MMSARLRVVQIEAVYPKYANDFYARSPHLKYASFDTQIESILASGWSGGQNVVPYMNPSQWQRFYIIPKLVLPQLAWAKQLGIPQSQCSLRGILYEQISAIQPDVIYLSDIGSFDFSILDGLKKKPLIVAWLATRFPPNIPWSQIDLLLSGVSAIRDEALKRGVQAVNDFNSAAPTFKGLPQNLGSCSTARAGLAFSGSFQRGYHDDREKMLTRLASERPNISIDIYTEQPFSVPLKSALRFHEPVFASDVVATYANHAIVIDGRADFGLQEKRFCRDTSNMRIFEATRAGSLLLTEYAPNLEHMFDIGKEIICFRSEEELIELVTYFERDENSREMQVIARRGLNRVLSSHMVEHRAAEFEKILMCFV